MIPAGLVRPPDAKTDMDTNPANLASAVVTYNFHQLPEYIDAGAFRLLPYDVERTVVRREVVDQHEDAARAKHACDLAEGLARPREVMRRES